MMSMAMMVGRAVRALCVVLVGAAALACSATAAAQAGGVNPYAQAINLQRAFADIYERVEPGVVTVFAETHELSFAEKIKRGMERNPQGMGSGFLVDKRGYLITNEHVVREGEKFSILLSDGSKYEGQVVGKDQLLDIALMKIVVPADQEGKEFPTVRLGDSDSMQPGMWALAIGNPAGYYFDDAEPVMSIGIVSGTNRTFVDTLAIGSGGLRTYGGLIQTDAAVNRGNSGGPLLNVRGEVVGVNTLGYVPPGGVGSVGINFAVPINTVRRKIPLLAKGYGVKRPMRYGTIDAKFETLNEFYADVLHLKGKRGVYVRQVIPEGAAATAGMQDKDVIFSVNGQRVVNDAQLVTLIAHYEVGKPATFEISRVVDGQAQRMTLNVVLNGKTLQEIEAAAPHESND
jgi:serine protease Do